MRIHHFNENRPLILLETEKLTPNTAQPRQTFQDNTLYSLAESIRENGILQPLTVRKTKEGYMLISGERRLRAAKMVGMKKVPCIVVKAGEQTAAVMALIENLQREDLSPFEEAEAIQNLVETFGLTREDVAARLGIACSTLSNKLRILKLTDWQKKRIVAAGLSQRHARALLQIENNELRNDVLLKVIAKELTVAQTEHLIQETLQGKTQVSPAPHRKAIIGDIRLFANTIHHAVSTMQRSGVDARAEKIENESFIQYKILIPKFKEEQKSAPVIELDVKNV
jgi:ParB family chromosome partitioning protein